MSERRCTCDSSEHVTVGCRVHHLMADGAPAADHEVLCMCGNFADDRACTEFTNAEDDEGPFYVCVECVPWADEQPHLERESA